MGTAILPGGELRLSQTLLPSPSSQSPPCPVSLARPSPHSACLSDNLRVWAQQVLRGLAGSLLSEPSLFSLTVVQTREEHVQKHLQDKKNKKKHTHTHTTTVETPIPPSWCSSANSSPSGTRALLPGSQSRVTPVSAPFAHPRSPSFLSTSSNHRSSPRSSQLIVRQKLLGLLTSSP